MLIELDLLYRYINCMHHNIYSCMEHVHSIFLEKNQTQHTRCWSLRIDAIYSSTPGLYIPVILPLAATPDWWHRTQPDGCSCQQLWVEIRFLLKKKYLYLSISSYPSIHPSIRVCVETYVIQLNSLWGLATLHGWGIQGSVVTRVDEQIDMGQNPWDHNLGDYHAFTLPAMHLALWPTTRSTKLGLPFF